MKQYNGGIIVWRSLASDYAMINMAGERNITNVMFIVAVHVRHPHHPHSSSKECCWDIT